MLEVLRRARRSQEVLRPLRSSERRGRSIRFDRAAERARAGSSVATVGASLGGRIGRRWLDLESGVAARVERVRVQRVGARAGDDRSSRVDGECDVSRAGGAPQRTGAWWHRANEGQIRACCQAAFALAALGWCCARARGARTRCGGSGALGQRSKVSRNGLAGARQPGAGRLPGWPTPLGREQLRRAYLTRSVAIRKRAGRCCRWWLRRTKRPVRAASGGRSSIPGSSRSRAPASRRAARRSRHLRRRPPDPAPDPTR